jgi:hypothetical protein
MVNPKIGSQNTAQNVAGLFSAFFFLYCFVVESFFLAAFSNSSEFAAHEQLKSWFGLDFVQPTTEAQTSLSCKHKTYTPCNTHSENKIDKFRIFLALAQPFRAALCAESKRAPTY